MKPSLQPYIVLILLTVPIAAAMRSLLLANTPKLWIVFFLAIVLVEEVAIAWLLWRMARLQESDRLSANRLQLAMVEGEQLQLEKAVLESRTKVLEDGDRLRKDSVEYATHELKNPLSSVKLVFQLLKHEPLSEKGEERLAIAEAQINVAVKLVEDMLDCFRLDSGAIEPRLEQINLGIWLPSVAKGSIPRAIARRQIINCSVETCRPLVSDEVMLRKVVEELLTNACKYSYNGARIEAIARLDSAIDRHVIEIINPIEPKDKIGFREQDKIWDRFYRIPEGDRYRQGGTGLGLSLVKELVKLLGGEVMMSSVGATVVFRVEL